jgi:hypothetical protein
MLGRIDPFRRLPLPVERGSVRGPHSGPDAVEPLVRSNSAAFTRPAPPRRSWTRPGGLLPSSGHHAAVCSCHRLPVGLGAGLALAVRHACSQATGCIGLSIAMRCRASMRASSPWVFPHHPQHRSDVRLLHASRREQGYSEAKNRVSGVWRRAAQRPKR